MSGLPQGWSRASLEDVADVLDFEREPINSTDRDSRINGKAESDLYPYYGATGRVGFIDAFRSEGQRVLLGEDAAPFLDPIKDKAYLANGRFWVNNHAHVLAGAAGRIYNEFLCHQLNTVDYRPFVTGSTRLKLTSAAMKQIPMVVAPYVEQTRIIAKLEELLSDLDAGVAELKAAQKKLTQYRQSLLEDVSQGTLLGDEHVEETTLGEIVISIGQGWSPKCENHPSVISEQWAVIKTTAIQPLSFDGSHNKQLPTNLTAREHLELQDGDLLVTRAGPRNRVGITCLVKSPRSKLILCDKAYRLKINEAKALPAFVELVLNSPRALQTIDTLKSGINDSGLNLTQDRFFTLPVKLPTLQVQQLLVNAFADANNEICDFESVIERSLSQAAAQRQNILRAAFAGQLVPQDPNDEPASVLLERIRAERAAQTKPKARSRKKTAPEFEDPAFSG